MDGQSADDASSGAALFFRAADGSARPSNRPLLECLPDVFISTSRRRRMQPSKHPLSASISRGAGAGETPGPRMCQVLGMTQSREGRRIAFFAAVIVYFLCDLERFCASPLLPLGDCDTRAAITISRGVRISPRAEACSFCVSSSQAQLARRQLAERAEERRLPLRGVPPAVRRERQGNSVYSRLSHAGASAFADDPSPAVSSPLCGYTNPLARSAAFVVCLGSQRTCSCAHLRSPYRVDTRYGEGLGSPDAFLPRASPRSVRMTGRLSLQGDRHVSGARELRHSLFLSLGSTPCSEENRSAAVAARVSVSSSSSRASRILSFASAPSRLQTASPSFCSPSSPSLPSKAVAYCWAFGGSPRASVAPLFSQASSRELPAASPPAGRAQAVLEEIKKMTLVEAAELVALIETTFGVSARMTVAAAGASGGASAEDGEGEKEKKEAPPPEKTAFDVVIKAVPLDKRISVIKTLRTVRTDLGLKEAKAVIDALPNAVLKQVDKAKADEAKKILADAGAEVALE
ncbi:radical SAM domain-containing protein [Besnoitia besnoiti]|uniref:Radical SAM domain-containing protein n=1 Tax=Besnoitia besnoiti TaxID=94643 RepID=A0A2A9M749_BESBE|nr:radical SAM domain-containing protein [Besnoitia besnoiti]PFH32131.1 radical SAM domain-containing protein [Besnoitia besnoiti]